MTNIEICHKALSCMTYEFSSNAFSKKIKKLGIDLMFIPNGKMNLFLSEHCNKFGHRLWVKKEHTQIPQKLDELQIAINIVRKSPNHRVQVLTQEWKDI